MMKRHVYIRWLLIAAITLLFNSCQKFSEEDVSFLNSKVPLTVKARSTNVSGISFPLYLYAFGENGSLVASQTIETAEESMKLILPEGDYRIVAVARVSEFYDVPENPSVGSIITLEGTSGAEIPLMMGKADVALSDGEQATLDITLSYAVAAVNVSLENLPADVSAVRFGLSALHSTLSFGGEYGGKATKLELPCRLDTNNVWSAETAYIFPGKDTETVFSIVLEHKDGTTYTYGYTYAGIPEVGRPFNISGSYSGGITVGGSLIGSDWGNPIEVEFEFGASSQIEEEEEETPEIDVSTFPEVGSIWNGTLVASVDETSETEAELLLLSLEEWKITTSQVDDVVDGYTVNDMADWHLPTYEEAVVLRGNLCGENRIAVNELIAEYDDTLYGLDGEERYLCIKGDVYYSFMFTGGTSITQAGSQRSYYTRLVKTVACSKK